MRASFNAPLLEQALVNLIDNAIKFSPADSTVRVEAQGAGSEIVIRVKDQGGGIAPEHLDRIFERFYRVDAGRSRKEGGTGLGLAIVKHIAQAHGGRVTVDSTPGRAALSPCTYPQINPLFQNFLPIFLWKLPTFQTYRTSNLPLIKP